MAPHRADPPDGSMLVVRLQPRERRAWYGLLGAGDVSVRVLGVAEQVAGECLSTPAVLVCRRPESSAGVRPVAGR